LTRSLLEDRIETGRLGRLRRDERAPGLRRDAGRRGGGGGDGGEREEPATDPGAAGLSHGVLRVLRLFSEELANLLEGEARLFEQGEVRRVLDHDVLPGRGVGQIAEEGLAVLGIA
jgi:hypothetical protein